MPPLPPQTLATWALALVLNGGLIALAQRAPLLTKAGWVHAGVLGTVLWGCLGWRGWLAVVAGVGGTVFCFLLIPLLAPKRDHDRGSSNDKP